MGMIYLYRSRSDSHIVIMTVCICHFYLIFRVHNSHFVNAKLIWIKNHFINVVSLFESIIIVWSSDWLIDKCVGFLVKNRFHVLLFCYYSSIEWCTHHCIAFSTHTIFIQTGVSVGFAFYFYPFGIYLPVIIAVFIRANPIVLINWSKFPTLAWPQ